MIADHKRVYIDLSLTRVPSATILSVKKTLLTVYNASLQVKAKKEGFETISK